MGFVDVAKSVAGGLGTSAKKVGLDFPKWGLGKVGSAAKGTGDIAVTTSKRVGGILNPYQEKEKVPTQTYETMNVVSRSVSRILVDGTRLMTFGSTFSKEMNEKIWGDPDIKAMLVALNRFVLNLGVSINDTGGPIGELISWLVSAGAITRSKGSLLPNIKGGHIAAGEVADIATLGALPSHAIMSAFQTARDLPILIKGMSKLIGYIAEDKIASVKQVGSAINKFAIKPVGNAIKTTAKVATLPVRWPINKARKLFKGVSKKTASISEKILTSGTPEKSAA